MDIKPFVKPIDDFPRENIDLIIRDIDIENQQLLTIATTGIPNIKFLLKNPKKIDSVDNNLDQIILNKLLLSGIANLSYEEFYKTFIDSYIKNFEKGFEEYFRNIKDRLLSGIPKRDLKRAEKIIVEEYRLGHKRKLMDWQLETQYNWFARDNFEELKRNHHKIRLNYSELLAKLKKSERRYDFAFLSNMRDTMFVNFPNKFLYYENLLIEMLLIKTSENAYIYITEVGENIFSKYSVTQGNRWLSRFNLEKQANEKEMFEINHYLLKKK